MSFGLTPLRTWLTAAVAAIQTRRHASETTPIVSMKVRTRTVHPEELSTSKTCRSRDPQDPWLKTWHQALLAGVVYEYATIPFVVTFEPDVPLQELYIVAVFYAWEVLFLFDIYVKFTTGFYEDGRVVRDARQSRTKYLWSLAFLVDVITIIPYSAIPVRLSTSRIVLETPKLLRAYRIPSFLSNVEDVYVRHFAFLKLFKLLVGVLLLSHFVACMRFSFGHNDEGNDLWLPPPAEPNSTVLSWYLKAMFWAFGLLTGLFEGELPCTINEFLFTILVALCGFGLFTHLCATFFMLSACQSTHAEASEARVNQISHVLTFHRVPEEARTQIVEYLRHYYAGADSSDREVMRLLCPSIAKDTQVELMKEVVARIPLFEKCTTQFLVALTGLLERISLPTQCTLFYFGDFGDAMYIIHSGVLDVLGRKAKIRELRQNDFVGELSLFSNQPRSATVVTTTYCVLYKLSRFHTELVLDHYPEDAMEIKRILASILEKTKEPATATAVTDTKPVHVRPMIKRRETAPRLGQRKSAAVHPSVTKTATSVTESGSSTRVMSEKELASPPRFPRLVHRALNLNRRRMSDAMKDIYDQFTRPRHIAIPRPRWASLLMQECIDSDSRKRLAWILSLQAVLIFNWCLIPLQLCFPVFARSEWFIYLLNALADAVLWVDIYGNFNLSYTHASEKIRDPTKSAPRYLRGAFLADLLCALPYDAVVPSASYCVARVPRLLRVWRLRGHFQEVDNIYPLRSKQLLLLSAMVLFLLIHLVACLHFSVTLLEGFSATDAWIPLNDIELSAINETHFVGHGNVTYAQHDLALSSIATMQYLRSFYYATNVLTALGKTLEPSSNVEYGVALVFMYSGFFITAVVVDNVQKRFTASALEEKEFFAVRSRIQVFLRRQNAPFALHHRVNLFLDFWWASHRGAIIEELLSDLPVAYKREVLRSICKPVLQTLALLSGVRPHLDALEEALVDNAKFVLYGQGEFLYREGDNAHGLFFLLEGSVSLATTGLPSRVQRGGCFGTQTLLASADQAGYAENAIAASGCVVLFVSRHTLQKLYDAFPALAAELASLEKRLLRTKLSKSAFEDSNAIQQLQEESRWLPNRIFGQSSSIDPDSPYVIAWETWLFLVMTAQWIRVMVNICFFVQLEKYVAMDAMTIAMEASFVLDIYLRSRLGYHEFGNKVMNIKLIRRRYFRSGYFAIDIVAVLPLFMINWLPSVGHWELFNLNKLVRLLKVPNQFRALEQRYLKYTNELRLLKLVYYTLLSSHVLGAIYFDFSSHASQIYALTSGETTTTNFGGDPWVSPAYLEHADISHQYTASLFWAFGLMSASSAGELPKTTMQCVFSIVTVTTGFFLFAYVVGNFSDVIELGDAETREFNTKLGSVRRLLDHFSLPPALATKLKMFFFFKRFHSITQEEVLERCLPPSLMTDVRLLNLRAMIEKVPFLGNMDAAITRMLVAQFRQLLVLKDDYVYKFGDDGSDMFFVFTGRLTVLAHRSSAISNGEGERTNRTNSIVTGLLDPLKKLGDLGAGDFFGENALFSESPRNSFVRATTSCILYVLSRHSLNMVFDLYPNWKNRVLQSVKIQQKQQKLRGGSTSRLLESTHSLNSPLSSNSLRPATATSKQRLRAGSRAWRVLRGWVVAIRDGIEAQSPLHLAWLRIVTAGTFYMAFFVPYCIAIDSCASWEGPVVAANLLEICCFVVFLLDIWVNWRLKASALSTELYEYNLRDSYRRERLLWDVLAALPVQYLLSPLAASTYGGWASINRVVKVFNVAPYMKEIHRQHVSYEWARLQTILSLYLLVIFWSACAYLLLAEYGGYGSDWNEWLPSTEVQLQPDSPAADVYLRLLRGVFFAVTAFVKKGRTFVPGSLGADVFAIVVCFVGLLVMAFMIGELASLFISFIANEVIYRKHQIAVELSLARWKASPELNARVHAFLSTLWSSHRGVDYQEVFDSLPPKLRQETLLHLADGPLQALLDKVFRPLVQGDTSSLSRLARAVADHLQFASYPRGEFVLTEGLLPDGLFFVVKGQLEATTRALGPELPVARYATGDYVGHRGLLAYSVSQTSVQTQVACDLLWLRAGQLVAILRADDFFSIVLRTVESLLRELREAHNGRLPESPTLWGQHLRALLLRQRLEWALRLADGDNSNAPRSANSLWGSVLTGVLDAAEAPLSCLQLFEPFLELATPQGELFDRTATQRAREAATTAAGAAGMRRQRVRRLVRQIGAVAMRSGGSGGGGGKGFRVRPLLDRISSARTVDLDASK